jgi:hypothetical protein
MRGCEVTFEEFRRGSTGALGHIRILVNVTYEHLLGMRVTLSVQFATTASMGVHAKICLAVTLRRKEVLSAELTQGTLPSKRRSPELRDTLQTRAQKTNTLSMQFSYGLRPNDHTQEVELVQFISN